MIYPSTLKLPIYEDKVGLNVYLRPEREAKAGFDIDIIDRGFCSSSYKFDISYSIVSLSFTLMFYG